MAGTFQTDPRLAADRGGANGTLQRFVFGNQPFWIEPQLNVFGALAGGKHIGPDGKEVSSPKLIKTVKVPNFKVENFTQENNPRYFTVTSGATADGTSIGVSTADGALTLNQTLYQVAETGDVIYQNAANSSGTLTIVRFSGSSPIAVGNTILVLGQLQGEITTSLPYVLRDEDNHYQYTGIFSKTWERSRREQAIAEMRYTGNSYSNDRAGKRREIMYDIEANFFGSKRSASVGSNAATTPRGLEEYASVNGTYFDFEGSVETGELRQLGILAGSYTSKKVVCFSSIEAITAIQSAQDSSLRIKPSDLSSGSGLPLATSMQLGPTMVDFVPTQFYSQPGKEGQGIIVDTGKINICELTPMELYEAMDGEDHTASTSRKGQWYYDACIHALDAGKHIVKFGGANNFSN